MNNEGKLIMNRIESLFKRLPRTFYHIEVVNDCFDQTYNFFFCIQPQKKRKSSIPLHSVETYKINYLEQLIQQLKKQTALTFEFIGFEGCYWSSGKLIQKYARKDE